MKVPRDPCRTFARVSTLVFRLEVGRHKQGLVHLVESLLGLVEEALNDRSTELVVSFVVHLSDLLEGRDINDFRYIVDLTGGAC